jgi:hypothetical protein
MEFHTPIPYWIEMPFLRACAWAGTVAKLRPASGG